MSEITNFYVVGDKFKEFAKHENVITAGALESYLDKQCPLKKNVWDGFVLGQGVRQDQFSVIRSLIKNKKIKDVRFLNEDLMDIREDKKVVHKHLEKNVLITKPKVLETGLGYESYLILDERCAEMSDHVTGQHLQGMLLTEAARQMLTSVTERYILDENDRYNFYFALSKISPTFHCFAFPVEVLIRYEQLNLNLIPSRCLKSSAKISFEQNGKLLCEVEIEMSAFSKNVLKKMEQIEAEKLLKQERR